MLSFNAMFVLAAAFLAAASSTDNVELEGQCLRYGQTSECIEDCSKAVQAGASQDRVTLCLGRCSKEVSWAVCDKFAEKLGTKAADHGYLSSAGQMTKSVLVDISARLPDPLRKAATYIGTKVETVWETTTHQTGYYYDSAVGGYSSGECTYMSAPPNALLWSHTPEWWDGEEEAAEGVFVGQYMNVVCFNGVLYDMPNDISDTDRARRVMSSKPMSTARTKRGKFTMLAAGSFAEGAWGINWVPEAWGACSVERVLGLDKGGLPTSNGAILRCGKNETLITACHSVKQTHRYQGTSRFYQKSDFQGSANNRDACWYGPTPAVEPHVDGSGRYYRIMGGTIQQGDTSVSTPPVWSGGDVAYDVEGKFGASGTVVFSHASRSISVMTGVTSGVSVGDLVGVSTTKQSGPTWRTSALSGLYSHVANAATLAADALYGFPSAMLSALWKMNEDFIARALPDVMIGDERNVIAQASSVCHPQDNFCHLTMAPCLKCLFDEQCTDRMPDVTVMYCDMLSTMFKTSARNHATSIHASWLERGSGVIPSETSTFLTWAVGFSPSCSTCEQIERGDPVYYACVTLQKLCCSNDLEDWGAPDWGSWVAIDMTVARSVYCIRSADEIAGSSQLVDSSLRMRLVDGSTRGLNATISELVQGCDEPWAFYGPYRECCDSLTMCTGQRYSGRLHCYQSVLMGGCWKTMSTMKRKQVLEMETMFRQIDYDLKAAPVCQACDFMSPHDRSWRCETFLEDCCCGKDRTGHMFCDDSVGKHARLAGLPDAAKCADRGRDIYFATADNKGFSAALNHFADPTFHEAPWLAGLHRTCTTVGTRGRVISECCDEMIFCITFKRTDLKECLTEVAKSCSTDFRIGWLE